MRDLAKIAFTVRRWSAENRASGEARNGASDKPGNEPSRRDGNSRTRAGVSAFLERNSLGERDGTALWKRAVSHNVDSSAPEALLQIRQTDLRVRVVAFVGSWFALLSYHSFRCDLKCEYRARAQRLRSFLPH